MKTKFEHVPVWSIIWRFIVYSIGLGIVVGLISVWIFPSLFEDASTLNTVLSFLLNLVFYGVLFYSTKLALTKKNYSLDAVLGSQEFEWSTIGKYSLLALLTAITGYSFSYVALILISLIPPIKEPLARLLVQLSSQSSSLDNMSLFVTAVLVAPVVEEIFFRGILTGKLSEKYGNIKGIFWSAFIFMIIHIPSLFIPQLILGLVAGVVYLKTKKIIYPILIHAIYNLAVVLPSLLSTSEGPQNPAQSVDALLNPSGGTWFIYIGGALLFFIGLGILFGLYKKAKQSIQEFQAPYAFNLPNAPDNLAFEEQIRKENQKALEEYRKLQEENEREMREQKFQAKNFDKKNGD